MIDATARLVHYFDHLAPVWRALPDDVRGDFHVPPDLIDHATRLGVLATPYVDTVPWRGDGPILVAASQDLRRTAGLDRPVAYLPHGVGQSFVTSRGTRRRGYAGGAGFDDVNLFLAPNDRNADLWRAAYPGARVVVTGCPKLGGRAREAGPRGHLVVASFHWLCGIGIPEAGSAWRQYRPHLHGIAARHEFALHAHPRIRDLVSAEADRLGVEFIEGFDEVLDRGAVYVNDCSSTLYEFAAYGGPVVVLNSRTFRRHINHGLRFWDLADVGVNVDRPTDLDAAITAALEDAPQVAARRREVSRELYPHDDAAERAAAALVGLAAERVVIRGGM